VLLDFCASSEGYVVFCWASEALHVHEFCGGRFLRPEFSELPFSSLQRALHPWTREGERGRNKIVHSGLFVGPFDRHFEGILAWCKSEPKGLLEVALEPILRSSQKPLSSLSRVFAKVP
jgi:hypothetical protein